MSNDKALNIFWFRRDLRLKDNHGLYEALVSGGPVQCIFIFDTSILDKLESRNDARVSFIWDQVQNLKHRLNELGADLWVYHGKATSVWKKLIHDHQIQSIYYNRDYEPAAIQRDEDVKRMASNNNIVMQSYKDHVVFESHEILKDNGQPYVVYTPYKRKWLLSLSQERALATFASEDRLDKLNKTREKRPMVTLEQMGFERSPLQFPGLTVNQSLIKQYAEKRDYPAIEGTSKLGVHFRFGTISIREKAAKSRALSEVYLSELIWRDFYSQILHHFPKVVNSAFREKYDAIDWRNDEQEFQAWCDGMTGYPMVDAGMRELNHTGYMHNRVRMVVASFLTKHLLIDWRWGEAYFAAKLLDFDLASNNGGWQWAAGCGTDAAPYFRIFNPSSQHKKFDKHSTYIKKWLPEYGTERYPQPIVDHKWARERCLKVYKEALT